MRDVRWITAWVILALIWSAPGAASDIHEAIDAGDAEQVAALLAADPELLEVQRENATRDHPLHTAAFHGRIEIARLLLEQGADIEAFDIDESTPLHVAALFGQEDMVALLLERGADVNRRDRNGAYALSFAVSGGDSVIVRQILDAGADLNARIVAGQTLLHLAASTNQARLVDLLIARGDDVNAMTDDHNTPLHWVLHTQHVEMTERLLVAGADPDLKAQERVPPLSMAAVERSAAQAQVLLDHGANLNVVDDRGRSPLMVATGTGASGIARMYLAAGADPNARDEDGSTVIISAARSGDAELIPLLVEAGADPNGQENHDQRTALQEAAVRGYADVCVLLVAHDAALDPVDVSGRTALDLAGYYGHGDVTEVLVAAGAPATGAGIRDCQAGIENDLPPGEAMIWYLGHSGWAIRTASNLLVFDYHEPDRVPEHPTLCNGHIDPVEIADLNPTVFVSHEHGDHYDPFIFQWRQSVPDITYVLGWEADAPDHLEMGPRETRDVNGMEVTTIQSNGSGVGYMIEVDGLTIFHPGDHVNRLRDLSGPYMDEIGWLADRGVAPDISFMPISGCNFGDQEAVRIGAYETLRVLKPRVVIPQHAGSASYRYREFIEACEDQFPDTQMAAPRNKGDRFHYVKGRLS